MADYNYNPYPKGTPSIQPQGSSEEGVKYRIYNIFKPTIVLDELSLRSEQTQNKTHKIEDLASLRYPLIKINNYFIGESDIEYFNIDSRGFLPTITLTVSFINELFLAKEMPKDGDIISIAIRNKSDILNIIRNDYVITSVSPMRRSTTLHSPVTITFFGELFIPGLKGFLGSAAFKGTSMNVLKQTASNLGLGFNTNENNTKDKQIWYRTDIPLTFIKDTTEKAWKDDDSFFEAWIDIYYNLNFVNVQKQLLSSEDDVDIGAVINNIDKDYYWGANVEAEKTIETPKVFSNFIGYKTTSFYISDWKPINRSSSITFEYGTSMKSTFFEHLDFLYEDPENKKYWDIRLEPAYDKDKLHNHILLRGRNTYNPEIDENELARANYNYLDLYKKTAWLGIQYTINNPDDDNLEWTGNMHKNYMKAQVHNLINLVELEKLNLEINVQGTNLNIIKGDKIPAVIIRKDRIENRLINEEAVADAAVDLFYSGWYYVKGFSISYTKKEDSIFSNFTQNFILTRREWPSPEPIEAIKLPREED